MGSYQPLSLIQAVQEPTGPFLFQNKTTAKTVFPKKQTALLIGMMKQVILSGTAQWVRPFTSFPTAGKTGTSNQEKDSWFVGFTPRSLTTIWVGYDDNSSHGLTGAGGALLIWLYFMQNLKSELKENGQRVEPGGAVSMENEDFQWPPDVEEKEVPHFYSPLQKKQKKEAYPEPLKLIFEKQKSSQWYDWLFKNKL